MDPSGPLATLRRLLLSDASLANFQRWMIDRWYIVAAIILVLLLILVSFDLNLFFYFERQKSRRVEESKINIEDVTTAG